MKTQRHGSLATLDTAHGIDLAPMLDFVLNLLIFFIITAILVKEVAVEVNRPTSLDGRPAAGINIQILETGEIFFNSRLVDPRAIRANVEREKAANSQLAVTVLASDGASTGMLMNVIDQVRLGGLHDITFATSE